ncbi:enolase-phosphatase E1-like [Portunus trituberculatus]|nr:enolase-phosphatase E1-like [Portunus trituberculatus]XP_045135821.1 enolase-phosphatase E1-like [Portunus trituberculatus]
MKRGKACVTSIVKDASVILLDIEGTTTSISFVKNELFPYVRREVGQYLQRTWDNEETKRDVAALSRQVEEDVAAGLAGSQALPSTGEREAVIAALVANVEGMMDADRKVGPLKALQGHMWRRAYQEGAVEGHVYDDVVPALEEWRALGKRIYIYSSGSVEAQKLLFGHSCHGDLLHFFSGHFDTSVGAKVDSQSYRAIVSQLQCGSGEEVLFITDLEKEAFAAAEAGMQVVVSVREGTTPLTQACLDSFYTITSFVELSQEDPDSTSPSPKKPRLEAKGEEEKVKGDGEADGHKNGSEKDKGTATEKEEGGKEAVQN